MGAADARHATGGGDGLHLSMLRCRGAADAEQTTGDIRTPGQAARPDGCGGRASGRWQPALLA
jgi:hypothetical protein